MNAFFKIAQREIKRIIKRRFILVVLFILPLVSCFVLAAAFSSGTLTNLPIAVFDQDNSEISRKLVRMIDATPSIVVKHKVANINEGKDLIKSGKAYGFLIIPKEFNKDLNKGNTPPIAYYYNNQTILIGGVITKDVQTVIQTLMTGVNIKIQMKKGLPKDVALTKTNLIKVDEHVMSNPYLNYSYFLTYATFAHSFHIIIIFLAIWAMGIEFKEGTTKEWLECANGSIIVAVYGKLSVYTISFLLLICTAYSGYVFLYGAPFKGNLIFFILGSLIFILAYQVVGAVFVAILSNLRFALSAGAFYTSLGMTFAGMTFPNMGMPIFGRFYSALLPIRPYVALVVDQTMRGFSPKYDLIYVIWILAFIVAGTLFLPLLKKHAKDENLWYQI